MQGVVGVSRNRSQMGFLLLHHISISLAPLKSTTVSKFSGYPKCKASVPQKELSICGQKSTKCLSSKSNWFADIRSQSINSFLCGFLALALSLAGVGIAEGKVGFNKPELLPKQFTPVIDIAGYLSDGQENRLAQVIAAIERDTGFKLRILVQNYPETPGLAIKDFWKVDDRTIVFVADPTFGNILHFNVGPSVDLDIPHSFWSRLAGKYGNMFYWKEKGEDASIEAAVMAIADCLRETEGANNYSAVK